MDMKILYVIGSLGLGGAERRLVELLKGLRAHPSLTCELVVLSTTVFYEEVHRLGIPVHIVARRTKRDLRVLRELYRICRRFGPDILHAWESMPALYAAPIARLLGIRFINGMIMDTTADRRAHPRLWLREKLTFPLSDLIVANSRAGLIAHRAPPSKSHWIHNGIDLARFQALESRDITRKRFDIDTPYVVGMVARFSPLKDYTTYLRAAVRVVRKRADVTFLAVGDGPTIESCRNMIPPDCRRAIRFPGPRQDIESVVNLFDIGVLVTNADRHREGISNAILEYMALGKPVIATDGGGTPELVVPGQTGFLVPPFDVARLAERIHWLLDHGDTAQTLGRAGRARAAREFSLEKMTERTVALYRRGLGLTPEPLTGRDETHPVNKATARTHRHPSRQES